MWVISHNKYKWSIIYNNFESVSHLKLIYYYIPTISELKQTDAEKAFEKILTYP